MFRRIIVTVVFLVIAGLIGYAFVPRPTPVDIVVIGRDVLRVTVDEDGKTQIKERYAVSAPLAGRLMRIELDPGDNAGAGDLLAAIEPRDPELLDARALTEAEARVESGKAGVSKADADVTRSTAELDLAKSEADKIAKSFAGGAATERERDDANLTVQVREQELNAARFAQQIAVFQLQLAEAALLRTRPDDKSPSKHFEIRAPCNGRVLRVFQKSEGFVTAGTPLLEFGDPSELECVIDVLSVDAVAIERGDEVMIEHWGGAAPLKGRVRVVEPSAFTKVSSLGVEEQRVNVIVDFVDPPDARRQLGDGYRIEARIVVWEGRDVLKVPTSALFRHDEQWAVFRVIDGKAVRTGVKLGRQSGLEAEIVDGLAAGDQVIVHPSDKVADGVRVEQR